MGFYIRDSISVGPFRFNLSKSGVGLSVGVRGFRVGTGPRGHYVHAGAHGLYYRASLNGAGQRTRSKDASDDSDLASECERARGYVTVDGIQMTVIASGEVMLMRDETSAGFVDELNTVSRRWPLSVLLGIAFFLVPAVLISSESGSWWPVIFGAIGVALGWWMDQHRRKVVLFYDLEEKYSAAYAALVEAFERMAASQRVWHIPSAGRVFGIVAWKRNSGASTIVDRKIILLDQKNAKIIKTNVPILRIPISSAVSIYFLPDRLIILSNSSFGSVSYQDIKIQTQPSRFIETDSPPTEAKIVGHTWMHPNKDGGPDLRFAANRQLPICLYEDILFTSPNGLQELIEISANGRGEEFAKTVRNLALQVRPNDNSPRTDRPRLSNI